MADGHIDGSVYQAPHCDNLVLHAPGKCQYCDAFPEAQADRVKDGVNFTGESDPNKKQCPAEARRSVDTINRWGGNVPRPDEKHEKPVCICLAGRSRWCPVHGDEE